MTGEASTSPGASLTMGRIEAAADRIGGLVRRTDVLTSSPLDEICAAHVFVKPENFQRSGSFKFRGALNRILQLTEEERRAGIVAYSSGNHGAAVALAASIVGATATIVVPNNAATAKTRAIAGFGGEIRPYDPEVDEPDLVADAYVARTGASFVRPFDDYEVMAGQGTLALELFEDVRELDLLLVPVGGGGLAAGVSTVAKSLAPSCRVVGVEPALADDTHRSLLSGERLKSESNPTIADGLRTPVPGALTFPINQANLDGVVLVSEDDIVAAMRFCFEAMKLVVEPSGAVCIAALLNGAVEARGARVGLVISGGNVDIARFVQLTADSETQRRRVNQPNDRRTTAPRSMA
ncbi:MAG: threonine/serine dehydratase [Acidimicrobiales bacterium]